MNRNSSREKVGKGQYPDEIFVCLDCGELIPARTLEELAEMAAKQVGVYKRVAVADVRTEESLSIQQRVSFGAKYREPATLIIHYNRPLAKTARKVKRGYRLITVAPHRQRNRKGVVVDVPGYTRFVPKHRRRPNKRRSALNPALPLPLQP